MTDNLFLLKKIIVTNLSIKVHNTTGDFMESLNQDIQNSKRQSQNQQTVLKVNLFCLCMTAVAATDMTEGEKDQFAFP